MKLLVFLPEESGAGCELERIIAELGGAVQPDIHRTIESLFWRMRQPLCDIPLAVLVAGTRQDLASLLDIGHFLHDLRIILILPDEEEETIARGHILRPRLLSFADGDLADVAATLRQYIDIVDNHGAAGSATLPESKDALRR
jgi:hypothetical protein